MTVMGPKRNDLEPPLYMDIEDAAGIADFTTVGITWKMIARLRNVATPLFTDSAPTVTVNPAVHSQAVVKHVWVSGETASAGVVLVEVEVTWPGGRKQTFPNAGYGSIRILEDLA